MLPLVALFAVAGFHQQFNSAGFKATVQRYAETKSLDDLAEAIRKDNKLPGLCIAYQKGSDKTESAVVGLRNMQNTSSPIEDDDRLPIGAIGKSMTAMLIAHLVETQKLSWKTTLSQAMPDIALNDAYKNVTISDLMHHKAKLPRIDVIAPARLDKILAKPEKPTDIRKAFLTELLSLEPEAVQSPSTDTDFVVAGYVAERVIRQSYEWLMQRYVFNPLKMSSAMIEPIGSADQVGSANAVVPHIRGDFGFAPYLMPPSKLDYVKAPAGAGISCSISDLVKYATYHLKGIRGEATGLTAESYKLLHTPEEGDKNAVGWIVDLAFAGEACHYFTGTDGSFWADMTIWPKSGLVIVAVTNAGITRQPSPTMIGIMAVKAKLEQKD